MAQDLGRAQVLGAAVPGEFGHLLPLLGAEVAQQGVELGGLGGVRHAPGGHRQVRRTAGQAPVEHLLAQCAGLVQRLLDGEPAGRLAEPSGLLGALRAVGQVEFEFGGLGGGDGAEGPGAEQ